MLLEFKQLNPCNFLDAILNNKIKIESLKHTGKNDETLLAETIWIRCNDEDVEKIKSIAKNLDNTNIIKVQPTEQEKLLSSVLLENAEIKEQLKQQQELSATLALQIAQLKGGNANV